MPIEIFAVGGFGESGKNMTAIKVDDDVVVFDMGIHLPNYIEYTEAEDLEQVKAKDLMKAEAIPDDSKIKNWRDKVKGIFISHAHLDHIGAVPFMADRYDAPVVGTEFTISFLKRLLKDHNKKIPNKLQAVKENSTYRISQDLAVEFIHSTHSIPQSSLLALHTKYGVVLYALDFKFDDAPVIGGKPNRKALQKIGEKGVLAAITDSLYADKDGKTMSESVVKEMLKDVMFGVHTEDHALIITTFASHIGRLKTITSIGKQMGRKMAFLGRSLERYTSAAKETGLIDFKDVKITKYRRQSERMLRKVQKEGPEKWLLVVTGHQGEPNSTLRRMTTGELPFKFAAGDIVIFSSKVIPVEVNEENRRQVERRLRKLGVRVFTDVHVSGHPAREDLRELFRLAQPKYLVPAHAEEEKMQEFKALAEMLGYRKDKIHFLYTGDGWTLK